MRPPRYVNALRRLVSVLALSLAACPQRMAVWVRRGSTATNLTFELGLDRGRAEPRELWNLDVTECRTGWRPVWRLAASRALLAPEGMRPVWDLDPSVPHTHQAITYGVVPRGYVEERPAVALRRAWCYEVRTDGQGTGITAFRVLQSGEVEELSTSEVDALVAAELRGIVAYDGSSRPFTPAEKDSAQAVWHAPQRADSLALSRCYVGYHSARTWADTLEVDRRVPFDTTSAGLLTYTAYPARGMTCRVICTNMNPTAGPDEARRRSECSSPLRRP